MGHYQISTQYKLVILCGSIELLLYSWWYHYRQDLLSACGPATFKTIESVLDAEKLKDIKYADLVKTLSEHYDLVPSSIVQRYKFYNQEGESIADFVAFLREIAKYSDYKETLNMMHRDRLVCGVNH